jgi:cell division protease FtsH
MPAVRSERRYSEETAREIDRNVRTIIEAAYQKAVDTLTRHRDRLERGARLLMEKETLTEGDLKALCPERDVAGGAGARKQGAVA